jgi:small-conductance mechanosensitive channel
MTEFFGVKIPMDPWVVLPLVFISAVVLAYSISMIVLSFVKKLARDPSSLIGSRIVPLLETYLFPLMIIAVLLVIMDALPLPPKIIRSTHTVLEVLGILLAMFLLTRAVLLVLRGAESRYEAMRHIRGPIEIFTKIILIAIGAMIILDNLGISLTPIITTLGIGSLAVAIALQDTLGNFFAGLYIRADRPVEVGHFVRLESGEEGYVYDIGWRNTKIRMLSNNMVILPNNKLVQSVITNYYLPDPELAVLVEVGVHYESDLGKVDRVTREAAKEVLQSVPGGVPAFEPFIRYHTFSQSSINFTVILRAREFTDSFLIKHEFIRRLKARYKEEGITIPFPIRTIDFGGKDPKVRVDIVEAAKERETVTDSKPP